MAPSLGYFLLSGLLLLSRSENELSDFNLCPQDLDSITLESNSSLWEKGKNFKSNFSCFLHASDFINCSWSFPSVNLQLYSSVCDEEKPVHKPSLLSRDKVGWKSFKIQWKKTYDLILHFNMSLNDSWGFYSYLYSTELLEILPPPSNITASVNKGALTVRWAPPSSRLSTAESCFEYQIRVPRQQNEAIKLTDKTSYTMMNADPGVSYHVSLRVRKTPMCLGSSQWSEWTDIATVAQSYSLINLPVIISISLVIPMLLLSLLLCLRLQRVSDVLFPQIPDIPKKYKNFIERSETYINYPVESIRKEEEITKVEESNPADV